MLDQIAVPALAAAAAFALYKNSKRHEDVVENFQQGMLRAVQRTVAPLDGRCMGYSMDGIKGYSYMGPAYTNFKCRNGSVVSGCRIPANEGFANVPSVKQGFSYDGRATTKTIDVLENQDFVRIENFKLTDPGVDRSSLYNRPIQQLPFAPVEKTGYGLYTANQGGCSVYPEQTVVEGFAQVSPGVYKAPAGMAPQVALDKAPMSAITNSYANMNAIAADAAKNEAVASLKYSTIPLEVPMQGQIKSQDGQVVDNVYMVDRTFLGVTAGGIINRNTSCPFRGDLYITPCPVGRMDPAQYSQLDGLKTGYIQFHLADDSAMAKQNLVQEILTSDPTCTAMPSAPDAMRASFEASSGKDYYTSMY